MKNKSGFGLIEVMAAAVVLGFLIIGLNILQKGNRESVLRIRARDAAEIVAQDFIDSLSRVGISFVNTGAIEPLEKIYSWKGNNGNINSEIAFTINGEITENETLQSVERSDFTNATKADTIHTPAKKIDLTVSWQFKNSPQSISKQRVIE